MGGYMSFEVSIKEQEVIRSLKKLTIETVTEVLDFVKVTYESSFLLTEEEFDDVRIFLVMKTIN